MSVNDYLQGINNATAGQTADVKTASQDLSNLQAGGGNLSQKLKDALNTKLNNNKDIINQQSQTMSNYFNSGAEARQKYQNIWDPFEKAKLVEQAKSMALQPYDTLSNVLTNRMGTVSDIVNSGVSGWTGLENAATTKLQAAQSNLTNALQAYQLASSQQSAEDQAKAQAAQAAEQARQFGITSGQGQQQIDINKFIANKPDKGSGGGLTGTDLSSIMSLLLGAGGGDITSEPTEPQPTYVPKKPGVKYHSPNGQWEYNWNYKSWVPTGSEVTN